IEPGEYPVLVLPGVLSVGTTNEGGTANTSWPIPTGQPVFVTIQVIRDHSYEVSESRITLDSCDGNMTATEVGLVDILISNYSFEKRGASPDIADGWVGIVDDDKRLCSGNGHTGDCGFSFKLGPAGKNKIGQIALDDPIAEPNDEIRLTTWIKANALPAGSSIIVKVKFPTLDKVKRKIDIPAGTYAYQELVMPSISIDEAPSKLTVNIQAKGGASGGFVIDDVLAQVAVNVGAPNVFAVTSPGPVALPGAMAGAPGNAATAIDLAHPSK
ncbi:MAG TPA: hypothetical protein VHL11_12325, partial [Phototrophicaceae bacterium]|nr:hypothetical protein [Phototrophicaceae bacterium]